ncbi:MAG TPA: nuclear transport factor 2 family protein [Arenimonas sp.]
MNRCIIVASLALAFAGQAQAACTAAQKAELEALDRNWGEVARKGDKKALAEIYSDHFHDLTPGAPQDKQAAIASASAGGADQPPIKHDFYAIHCQGDTAVITHRNTGTWEDGGESGTWYARSIHHLVREGGKWRVLANAGHPLDDAGVVTYLDLEWNQADMSGDKAWFERNLAGDYIGIGSRNGAMQGKKEAVADVGKYKVTQADSTDVMVQVEDDVARVSGIYHYAGTDDKGQAFNRKVRYIDTWIQRGGRWQVWSSQGTEISD